MCGKKFWKNWVCAKFYEDSKNEVFFEQLLFKKKIEHIFAFFSKFFSCNSAQKTAVLFWVCRGVPLSVCCNQVQLYPWDMRQCRVRSKRRQKKWQAEKRKKCRPDGNWTLASANIVNSLCILRLFLVFRNSVKLLFNYEKSETARFWRHFWNRWVVLRQVGIQHFF